MCMDGGDSSRGRSTRMTASSPATEGMEDGQHGDEDTITVGGREGGGVAREGDGGGDPPCSRENAYILP